MRDGSGLEAFEAHWKAGEWAEAADALDPVSIGQVSDALQGQLWGLRARALALCHRTEARVEELLEAVDQQARLQEAGSELWASQVRLLEALVDQGRTHEALARATAWSEGVNQHPEEEERVRFLLAFASAARPVDPATFVTLLGVARQQARAPRAVALVEDAQLADAMQRVESAASIEELYALHQELSERYGATAPAVQAVAGLFEPGSRADAMRSVSVHDLPTATPQSLTLAHPTVPDGWIELCFFDAEQVTSLPALAQWAVVQRGLQLPDSVERLSTERYAGFLEQLGPNVPKLDNLTLVDGWVWTSPGTTVYIAQLGAVYLVVFL